MRVAGFVLKCAKMYQIYKKINRITLEMDFGLESYINYITNINIVLP